MELQERVYSQKSVQKNIDCDVAYTNSVNDNGMKLKKVDVKAGQIVSWYNGVRVPCHVVDGRPDWSLNDNVINLDEETAIDVPPEWSSTKTYCASLGTLIGPLSLDTVLAAQLVT